MKAKITAFVAGGLLAATMGIARANYAVYVGYADDLRASPNFPNPWIGAPGVTFDGQNESLTGFHFDSGAVMVVNTGASDITFNSANVVLWNGTTYHLWDGFAPQTVHPGDKLILTQTIAGENFDSSDPATFRNFGDPVPTPETAHAPKITLSIDGASTDFLDTGHILDTGGFDLAAQGANESLGWRLIGTTGSTQPGNQLPDAGSTGALLGLGLAGLTLLRRKLSA